jgi:hypothetical protein
MTDRWIVIPVLLLLSGACAAVRGQARPVPPVDSSSEELFPEAHREDLVEQAAQADDSPVLDFSPFDPDPRRRDFLLKIRSRMTIGLERSRGYREGLFLGSPLRSQQRVEFSSKGGISGGLLLRKDAGERLLADFVSGYAMVTNTGPVAALIAGDYFIEAGQGIALWRGFDYGKGADPIKAVRRSGRGILPYRSSDETAFLRGVATELRFNSLSIAIFYSQRSLSATVDSSGAVAAFSTSGLFRTGAEQSNRNRLHERLAGFRSSLAMGEGKSAGITFYETKFSTPLRLTGGSRFAGSGYALAAVDYSVALPKAVLYGEWTILSGAAGGLSGATLTPSAGVELVATLRHYPRNLASLHGFGFGEQSGTTNEDGLYLGLRMKLPSGMRLSSYIDRFSSPRGSSASGAFPAGGDEWFARVDVCPGPDLEWMLQYQRKSYGKSERVTSAEGLWEELTNAQLIERVRTQLDLRLTREVRLRARLEKIYLQEEAIRKKEQGMMLYEDVSCAPSPVFSASVRIIFFRTGSYETRLTESENDLSGATSLPLLSGEGDRWYAVLNFRPCGSCEISAKYSRLTRDDIRRVGTGLDELPGNVDDRIGLQLDLRL